MNEKWKDSYPIYFHFGQLFIYPRVFIGYISSLGVSYGVQEVKKKVLQEHMLEDLSISNDVTSCYIRAKTQ